MSAEHHGPTPFQYLLVFGGLCGLTVLTVLASTIDFGGGMHAFVGLAIAGTKATLVALFFMHLWYSKRLVGLVFAAALLWLLILLALTFADYMTRSWI